MRVSFKLRHGTDLEEDQREKLEALVGKPIQRRKDGEGWDTWHSHVRMYPSVRVFDRSGLPACGNVVSYRRGT